MEQTFDERAMLSLWSALAPDLPPPELPTDELGAFTALIEALGELDVEPTFHLIEPEDEDPYPLIVMAEDTSLAELSMAVRVSGLLAFAVTSWEHITFYVDTVPDPAGEHRVFARDEETLPGLPHSLAFASIEEALRWMIDLARGEPDWCAGGARDDPHEGPGCGAFVLELLLELSLPFLWRAAVDGLWPEPSDTELPPGPVAPEPGWQRALCVRMLQDLVDHRRLEVPEDLDESALDEDHRAFVQHLRALDQVFRGHVPGFLRTLADSGDAAARAWITRFSAVRSPEPAAGEAEAPADEFEQRMVAALGEAVDALVGKELLEVREEDREPLLGELWTAAAEAENPKKMLDRLVRSLVDSRHVEEVYADDHEIRAVLISSFGG